MYSGSAAQLTFISVDHIVSRANNEDLMLLYSLPAFTKGDTDAFLSGLARSQQLIKKVRARYDLHTLRSLIVLSINRKVHWIF